MMYWVACDFKADDATTVNLIVSSDEMSSIVNLSNSVKPKKCTFQKYSTKYNIFKR